MEQRAVGVRWYPITARRDLLASARKLFAERGYHATSATDIAAATGVTGRTLLQYFPSKAVLVLDEAIALLAEMTELIRERLAGEAPYRQPARASSSSACATST